MSIEADSLNLPRYNAFKSNLTCFAAMVMWAFTFPIAEVMIESWGTVALVLVRQSIAVSVLCLFWLGIDGWTSIRTANWFRGITVGGLGFGLGAILFLVGQAMSDPVTPAIAASMMPIIGAILEIVFDGRRLQPKLLFGIVLAICGGLLATGTRLDEGSFGWGSLLCLCSVIMFAWATRATTHDFRSMSLVGRSAITLVGGVIIVWGVFLVMLVFGLPGTEIGLLDNQHMAMLVFSAVASTALAQFLWIRGNAGLGILLASFHMNAVPFYVMVIVVLSLDAHWNWWQAAGAVLVGVLVAQSGARRAQE